MPESHVHLWRGERFGHVFCGVENWLLVKILGHGLYGAVWQAVDLKTRQNLAIRIVAAGEWARQSSARFLADGEVQVLTVGDVIDCEWTNLKSLGQNLEGVIRPKSDAILFDQNKHLAFMPMECCLGQILYFHSAWKRYVVPGFMLQNGDMERDVSPDMERDMERDKDTLYCYTPVAVQLIARNLLRAVKNVHNGGIIHCDLKPDNILLKHKIPASMVKQIPRSCADSRNENWSCADYECNIAAGTVDSFWIGESQMDVPWSLVYGDGDGDRDRDRDGDRDGDRDNGQSLKLSLIDFNSSVKLESDSPLIYSAGGTQCFCPPEGVAGAAQGIDGFKRDVWAVGCVLYCCVFQGRLPFYDDVPIKLLCDIMRCDVPYPHLGDEQGLWDEAITFIKLLLDKNPQTRLSAQDALLHPWIMSPPQNRLP